MNNNEIINISPKLKENANIIDEQLGVEITFDIIKRDMKFGGKKVTMYAINGFVSSEILTLILNELANLDRKNLAPNALESFFHTYLTHIQVNKVKTVNEVIDKVLSGQLAFLIDNEEYSLIIDVRNYPGRQPEEPDTERVVRGARDGYTETLSVNTALTRRRIRDARLRMEIMQIGVRSKTDVCVAYLQDIADPDLVKTIKGKLQSIEIDGLPMGERSVEEMIYNKKWNPYPLVRYTERPDVAAVHIFEGHVLVFVDTSPSIMIAPTTFFHHLQHAEEYRQTPALGLYLRWIRLIGVFISLFLLPLWLLFSFNPDLLPKSLDFIGPKEKSEIPIFWQFMAAELGIDLMRMAAIHTPTPLATAMGLIAAVLIGDMAIKVGFFVPEVILYLSAAAIGMFATPSYEMGLSNKIYRLVALITVYLFKVPGFVVLTTIWIIYLSLQKSLNTPYLWPFIPFNAKALLHVLFRMPVSMMKKRPSIVRPQDDIRQ